VTQDYATPLEPAATGQGTAQGSAATGGRGLAAAIRLLREVDFDQVQGADLRPNTGSTITMEAF
jgi:hypothetical protein